MIYKMLDDLRDIFEKPLVLFLTFHGKNFSWDTYCIYRLFCWLTFWDTPLTLAAPGRRVWPQSGLRDTSKASKTL